MFLTLYRNTALSIVLGNINFWNVNHEENIIGLFFKKKRKKPCNESESESQVN